MKIGQLAQATGVSTSRIRFYEKHGLVPAPRRLANGYRDYPEETVSRLRSIVMSKSLGFTLSEIGSFLPNDPRDVIARPDVVRLLGLKLANLEKQVAELQEKRLKVLEMMAYFDDPNAQGC